MMPVYILPATAIVLFIITAVLCAVCHSMKRKKKRFPPAAQATGGISFLMMFILVITAIAETRSFTPTGQLSSKKMFSDMTEVDAFYVIVNDDKRAKALTKEEKETLLAQYVKKGDDRLYIKYKDSLYNTKKIKAGSISEVLADSDLSKDKVRITRYLVKESDGALWRYAVRYTVTFGE